MRDCSSECIWLFTNSFFSLSPAWKRTSCSCNIWLLWPHGASRASDPIICATLLLFSSIRPLHRFWIPLNYHIIVNSKFSEGSLTARFTAFLPCRWFSRTAILNWWFWQKKSRTSLWLQVRCVPFLQNFRFWCFSTLSDSILKIVYQKKCWKWTAHRIASPFLTSKFLPVIEFALGLITCEKCVFCNHTSHQCVMCAMYVWYGHTRLRFPRTAVAIRKATAKRQSQSTKNVCAAQAQSRDLNYWGLKTDAKVLAWTMLLWSTLELEVPEDKCGLCRVGVVGTRNFEPSERIPQRALGLFHNLPEVFGDRLFMAMPPTEEKIHISVPIRNTSQRTFRHDLPYQYSKQWSSPTNIFLLSDLFRQLPLSLCTYWTTRFWTKPLEDQPLLLFVCNQNTLDRLMALDLGSRFLFAEFSKWIPYSAFLSNHFKIVHMNSWA